MTVPTSALTRLPARDYAAIRKLVRTGDIALCSGNSPMSRAIRWSTESDWSHVALILRLEDIDRVMVLEAVQKIGVRMVPLSRFVVDGKPDKPFPGHIVIARHADFKRKATAAKLKDMNDFAADRLGSPFHASEIVKILARIAVGRFHRKLPHLVERDDEFICSEYVAECLKRVGIDIPWDGLGFLGPGDIAADPKVKAIARVSQRPLAKG